MPHMSSFRIIIIALILIALIAAAVSADWGSVASFRADDTASSNEGAADLLTFDSVNEFFGVYPMQKGVLKSEFDEPNRLVAGAEPALTPTPPPMITSLTATVSDSTALLTIRVAEGSSSTYVWIQYNTIPGTCSNTFGTQSPAPPGHAGVDKSGVVLTVYSLTMGATYYACAIVTNEYGTDYSDVISFTMLAHPPNVSTYSPSPPTATTVTLGGG